jgi:hypothetical protein
MADRRGSGRNHPPVRRRHTPLVDRVLLRLLGSWLRPLVDGELCALRYRTRTGATVTFPVRYERDEEGIVVRCTQANGKRWWRHFRRPAAVEVWLDGRWQTGVAHVVNKTDDLVTVRVDVGARFAPLSGRRLFQSWLPVVAAAELAGFAVPAVVGATTTAAPSIIAVTALILAGVVEGGLLGWGQASVLRRVLSNFPTRRWVGYTASAAGLAYLLGMLPSVVGGSWWVVAVVAVPLLLSIGTAQWLVLRGRVPWALSWIGVTAAAWVAGLAVFLAFATPLWWSGQALALTVLVGLAGGALMATTVAAVTGLALRSFVR